MWIKIIITTNIIYFMIQQGGRVTGSIWKYCCPCGAFTCTRSHVGSTISHGKSILGWSMYGNLPSDGGNSRSCVPWVLFQLCDWLATRMGMSDCWISHGFCFRAICVHAGCHHGWTVVCTDQVKYNHVLMWFHTHFSRLIVSFIAEVLG